MLASFTIAMTFSLTLPAFATGGPLGPLGVLPEPDSTTTVQPPAEAPSQDLTGGPLGFLGGLSQPESAPSGPDTSVSGATGEVSSTADFMVESLPDVQQKINSHFVSLRLLHPDQSWSDVAYTSSGSTAGLSSPQGFISMSLFSDGLPGDILYRTYSSASGWSRWVMNGEHAPWNAGSNVEAVQIRLNGVADKVFDISYSTTLSNGAACSWSYNGRTNGTMGTGAYITGISICITRRGLYDNTSTANLVYSATSFDGIRFGDGLPTYIDGTGSAFTGWAWNDRDRYYFVNNSAVTGWQYIDGYKYYFDESGKLVTDLEPIIGANGPYLIKVNKQMNCTTIYVQDGGNGYIIPLKSFLCSTGDDTPLGTFHTPEKYRWHEMIHSSYCQYLMRLNAGLHILLHSDIYSAPNPATLSPATYNYMGIARSSGCIRFVTGDAKWMYDHCPIGTTIQVYNSSIPGPYDRPCVEYFISEQQTWDPTDPEAVAAFGLLYMGS